MILAYPQQSNGMYFLKPSDYDDIAYTVLKEYNMASVIENPKEVDIVSIIKDHLYLEIKSKILTPDKSVMGLIAFYDTTIPCYDLHYNNTSMDVTAGTIIIDISLSGQLHLPRRRFTLAHELAHWILHRSYHSPTNQIFALRKNYLLCDATVYSIQTNNVRTDSDREEAQANALAAALLMPKCAFLNCAFKELRKNREVTLSMFDKDNNPQEFRNSVEYIASVFNVSLQSVEIRLNHFGLLSEPI